MEAGAVIGAYRFFLDNLQRYSRGSHDPRASALKLVKSDLSLGKK